MQDGASSRLIQVAKRTPLHKRLSCFGEPLWLGGGTYGAHIKWRRCSIGSDQNGKMA